MDIYLQRLTAEGEVASGWVVNGIPVCRALGDQQFPKLAPDATGGVFVVWEDYREGRAEIYAQRITSTGQIATGWQVDGLPVCKAPGYRGVVNILSDGQGGALIEWDDTRDLESSQADLYAVRITDAGEVAPGWVRDGTPICTAPGYQNYAVLVSDGQEGFIVAWTDTRSAPPGTYPDDYYDIYAQRVTGSGSSAPGWPVNGVALCTAPDIQWQHQIVSDGAGGAIVLWVDYRNRNVTASDLYAQRVLANGEIAPGWPTNGVPVSRARWYELEPTMVSDGTGGALVAYSTFESAGYRLYAEHLTSSGTLFPGWSENGVPLSSTFGDQDYPDAVSDGKGGMIVAWDDNRDFTADIYALRVSSDFPTPTLLSLVSAEAEAGRVVLTWSAGAAVPRSVVVYRRGEDSAWIRLGEPERSGNGRLVYEDRSVAEGRYTYRLGYVSDQGEMFTPEVSVTVPGAYVLALAGFHPNPAVGEAVISFSLATRSPARLDVFDASGRAMVTKDIESLSPGHHVLPIGRENRLAPGVYWVRLTQGGGSLIARGVVLQ